MYSKALADQYPDITSIAIHPGVIHTGLLTTLGTIDTLIMRFVVRSMPHFELPEGVYNTLWAATSNMVEKPIKSGECYEPVGEITAQTSPSADAAGRKELWEFTESAIAPFL
jgi:hypothetical protein